MLQQGARALEQKGTRLMSRLLELLALLLLALLLPVFWLRLFLQLASWLLVLLRQALLLASSPLLLSSLPALPLLFFWLLAFSLQLLF